MFRSLSTRPSVASSGSRCVANAIKYRIAVVRAAAGWGKSTAVKSAVRDIPHLWCVNPAAGEPGNIAASLGASFGIPASAIESALREARSTTNGARVLVDFLALHVPVTRLVVVDDLQALEFDSLSFAVLAELAQRLPAIRWIFISRQSIALPVERWIASGDAGAPVELRDLALTGQEIRIAAESLGARADEAAVKFLQEETEGWPVAIRFAIASLERSPDLSRAAASARESLSGYIESEILNGLDEGRRDFLVDFAMLGSVDEELLDAFGREDAAADLRWLSAGPVPIFEAGEEIVLPETLARHLLTRIPAAERKARAARVRSALQLRGYAGRAFDLARRYARSAALLDLQTNGFALLETGYAGSVDAAIGALPLAQRRDDASIVMLRAEIEARAGALERANDLYERAARLKGGARVRALVCLHRALHLLNQGSTEALEAIHGALDVGTEVERTDARSVHAMALALCGHVDDAREEAVRAVDSAKTLDDEPLLTRCVQRLAYVEFQIGGIDAAERHAREAARLAARTRSWIHFICAHSILLSLAVRERDDHSAALWHAQQIGFAAQRTGDRRHQVYALSAQYVFEVERGRRDRALAIETDLPPHTLGFRDELDCCVALATRRSWDGEFAYAFREVARLNERVVEPERRFWNACLSLFAAFAGDERAATMHLRACGKIPARVARENELGNAVADCYAAIAQVLLGNPEGALRRLPRHGASSQIRALASFVRELAALGVTLALDTAAEPIKRLKVLGQGGMAQAVEAALASRAQPATVALTDAERRVLQAMARGGTPKAIAHLHDRSLHTIRNQIKALNRKLGASGSMDAVAKARILGLLE